MDWWADQPDLLAGRDLRAGGTWMGVTRRGRFAAVTNYREACCVYPRSPSRGALVADFLGSATTPQAYLDKVAGSAYLFDGFNLVVGDLDNGLYYYGNRGGGRSGQTTSPPRRLPAGIYGLSNHRLDTPWPKVKRGKKLFAASLKRKDRLEACILEVLSDTAQPADADLPVTGVGLEWERILAPLFINAHHYGTRSCSVVRLGHDGQLSIVERTIPPPGETDRRPADQRFRFAVGGP
jgi:uncharacterized protein with NRDE domain